MLASPGDYDLANAVEKELSVQTLSTRRDSRIATAIHGCDVAALKGKTTKKPSKMPNTNEVRNNTSHIVKYYSDIKSVCTSMSCTSIALCS